MKLLRSEPALIVGAIQAALALAVAFGLHLTTEQLGAVTAAIAAILAVILRQAVVSPSTAVDMAGQAAFNTAAQLTSHTVGVAGSVTTTGEQIVNKTVAGVAQSVGGVVGAIVPKGDQGDTT